MAVSTIVFSYSCNLPNVIFCYFFLVASIHEAFGYAFLRFCLSQWASICKDEIVSSHVCVAVLVTFYGEQFTLITNLPLGSEVTCDSPNP